MREFVTRRRARGNPGKPLALATAVVLLAAGEDVTANAASTGAAIGALAVAFAWPLLQAARRLMRGR